MILPFFFVNIKEIEYYFMILIMNDWPWTEYSFKKFQNAKFIMISKILSMGSLKWMQNIFFHRTESISLQIATMMTKTKYEIIYYED